jgi:haloalkane dehalogenase
MSTIGVSVQTIDVLDTFISYREAGTGSPIVLLHGNPTSSHIWRNVIPKLSSRGRVVAPDLVGMGHSGKPDSAYHFADHARYLDAWFDALALRNIVLVGYDWGGVLALDWARRHPDRVRGVVVFETFVRPMQWSDWSPEGEKLFRALRTPNVGEAMVIENNEFLARSLEHGVLRGLAESDRREYYAPFPDPKSRRPMLQWPREIPIDGAPADVVTVVEQYDAWLARGLAIPAAFLTFEGSGLSTPEIVEWTRATLPALEIIPLGHAGHHAPEDAPGEIAAAIGSWLDRHAL